MITDSSNTIMLWNAACEKAYGIKKMDAIGENFFAAAPQLIPNTTGRVEDVEVTFFNGSLLKQLLSSIRVVWKNVMAIFSLPLQN